MNERIYITADQIQSTSCHKECQETSIHWLRTDEEVTIFTTDPTMITKLKNLMIKNPEAYQCYYLKGNIDEHNKPYAYNFVCDKSLVTLRSKQFTREYDEEERKVLYERLTGIKTN